MHSYHIKKKKKNPYMSYLEDVREPKHNFENPSIKGKKSSTDPTFPIQSVPEDKWS